MPQQPRTPQLAQTFDTAQIHVQLGAEIAAHAAEAYPDEACGLVLRRPRGRKLIYRRCANVSAEGRDRFQIAPQDWAAAEDEGQVLAVVHSHPDESAAPSAHDLVACRRSGLPWYIVAWPGGAHALAEPKDMPLVGREFVHGVVDCYTLVQDYFWQMLSIELPDFERSDGWWDRGEDLYLKGFAAAGFVELPPGAQLLEHDVMLMQVAARQVNHAAIYCGDQKILHHLYGRLSGHDVWGGYWLKRTMLALRHRTLL